MSPQRNLRHILCGAVFLLSLFCNSTHAQEAQIRKNLPRNVPQLKAIDEVRPSPIPGLYEVRVNRNDIYYTDATGNYLIQGALIDTRTVRNLTEERIEKLTAIKFDALPFKDAFTIVRGDGKRRLAVFEDPNCGYCKHFEAELQKVNNVTIYMFLYPVLGDDSVQKSKGLWCSRDRAAAWQGWMLREQPIAPAAAMCDTSPITRNVEFGHAYKIQGTPALIFSNGKRIPGAIDAQEIEKLLAEASKS